MNIQPIGYSNYNISYGHAPKAPKNGFRRLVDRAKQAFLDFMPEMTTKEATSGMTAFEERISRPAENRLTMGATALLTQPAIDYFNHRVDDETRTVSRNRTIAKIVAGTTVGMLVRGSWYEAVKRMTNIDGVVPVKNKKLSTALIPKKYLEELKNNPKLLKNHRAALSTGIAILVMLFTNFLIDAPLTVMLTNRFNAKSMKKKEGKEAKNV